MMAVGVLYSWRLTSWQQHTPSTGGRKNEHDIHHSHQYKKYNNMG